MFIFRLEFLNGLGREDATLSIEKLLLLLPSLFPAALFIFPRMELLCEDAHDHGELMESSPPGEEVDLFRGSFFLEMVGI